MIQAPKQNFKTLLIIASLGILFFSPLGNWLKLKMIQLTASSPKIEKAESIQKINTFSGIYYTETNEKKLFSDLKGKVILINLWATWCLPCVAEMPSLQALYEAYGDKIAFVLLTDEDPEKVKAFMEKKQFELPVFYRPSDFPSELASKSIPTTFLIDKEGNILIKTIGAANWNTPELKKELDRILNN